jgi:hypothetical protein
MADMLPTCGFKNLVAAADLRGHRCVIPEGAGAGQLWVLVCDLLLAALRLPLGAPG